MKNVYDIENGLNKLSDGKMQTGWINDNNNWYYLDSKGAMVTGRNDIDGNTYYFYSSGEMANGCWIQYGGSWNYYYGAGNGSMAYDTTINGYYINTNGVWEPSEDDSNTPDNSDSSNSQGTSDADSNSNDDGVSYPDYTEAINDMLKRNEPECFTHRKDLNMGLFWFRDQVDYNAPWDIKVEKRWKEQMPSVPYLGPDKNGNYGKFVFNGRITTAEELGNFTF